MLFSTNFSHSTIQGHFMSCASAYVIENIYYSLIDIFYMRLHDSTVHRPFGYFPVFLMRIKGPNRVNVSCHCIFIFFGPPPFQSCLTVFIFKILYIHICYMYNLLIFLYPSSEKSKNNCCYFLLFLIYLSLPYAYPKVLKHLSVLAAPLRPLSQLFYLIFPIFHYFAYFCTSFLHFSIFI